MLCAYKDETDTEWKEDDGVEKYFGMDMSMALLGRFFDAQSVDLLEVKFKATTCSIFKAMTCFEGRLKRRFKFEAKTHSIFKAMTSKRRFCKHLIQIVDFLQSNDLKN
jgi:hypothetical protein